MSGTRIPQLTTHKEEADVRMYFHAAHASTHTNAQAIIIRSNDTDVMVLGLYFQGMIDTNIIMQ